jgi:hypothetical protein
VSKKTLKPLIHVKITGTGVNDEFDAVSHEIVGLPAGTYHKFDFVNGVTAYWNDFGIRCVYIAKYGETTVMESEETYHN